MTEKRAHVIQAYFHERLLYLLCLHYRATSLQYKFQRSIVTVKNLKNVKKPYDEKQDI